MTEASRPHTCREALLLLLDQVDYTADACAPTEMVGAVLPKEVIATCRAALAGVSDTPEQRG